jgi:cobalt/nickel transport system permease protein
MQINQFKSICDNDTKLNHLDGRVKTVIFFSAIIIATMLSNLYLIIGLLTIAIIAYTTLNLPWKYLRIRLYMPFAIAWLVFLNMLFTYGHSPIKVFTLGAISITAYHEGFALGVLILFRIMTSITLCCVLSFSTPMIEILETLRLLKIPGTIIDLAAMMYRYVFIIQDTATSMHDAQLSRMGNKVNWLQKVTDTGKLATYVLIKSLDRSVRVYNSMLSRGYTDNTNNSDFFVTTIPKSDFYIGISIFISLLALLIVNYFV